MSKITDATGTVTTLGYDATGLTSLTNNGDQTSFGYDPTSRLTSWHFGVGSPATSNWAASYPTSTSTTITDGNSHAATYTIAGPTTTKITDPLTHFVTSNWDGFNNLTSRIDATTKTTNYAYGNLTTNAQTLTLLSDATGTALVDNSGAGVVNGTATVQRYIASTNSGLGYRHYSAPVSGST